VGTDEPCSKILCHPEKNSGDWLVHRLIKEFPWIIILLDIKRGIHSIIEVAKEVPGLRPSVNSKMHPISMAL
jgi:hypothetical protein